jgi:N4-gp56 family major capsid protein
MATTYVSNIPNSVRDVYSHEILYAAQPTLRFAQFAKRRDDLTVNPGGSVRFTKFNSLTMGGQLNERVPLTERAMTDSEIFLTVTEYGNAVAMSEKAMRQSMHKELDEAAKLLGQDFAKVLDMELMNAALSTTNYVYPNGKTSAASLVSGDTFSAQQIKDAVELLDTNNAPKINAETYVCIAHPHQLRQLRDDPDWIEAHKYTSPENMWKGEVGMYEGVRFISTTQMPANSGATSLTKYGVNLPTWEATIFGENSYAWAVALEVEMRDNGVEDYGRKHGLAWYALWGFGIVEENNIITLLSA